MGIIISHSTRSYPQLPYARIKDQVLGTSYDLSLTFVGAVRASTLNKKYRKATYVPNVLSFPLDKNTGEIYITPQVARREARKWGMTFEGYIGFLFIHGLLHLKGYPHGATMEKAEKKFISLFSLK